VPIVLLTNGNGDLKICKDGKTDEVMDEALIGDSAKIAPAWGKGKRREK